MSVQTLRESNFFGFGFFSLSFARRTDGLIDGGTDGQTMDGRSGNRRYSSPLSWSPAASVNWRLRDWLSWERGIGQTAGGGGGGGPDGPDSPSPPCLCMSLLCPGDVISRISEWIHTSQRVLVILQWVISRGYFLMICIAAVLLRIYCIDV